MLKIGSKIDEVRIDGSLKALKRDLEHFQTIGLEAVELPVHGLDAIKNGKIDRKRLREVREVLNDFAFKFSVHAPNPLNLMEREHFDVHFSVFSASLEFASEVGARVLVYHCGRFTPEETFHLNGSIQVTEAEKKRLLEVEKSSLVKLSENSPEVVIALENARPYLHHSPYGYGEKLAEIRAIVEQIGRPNIKVNLDVGHLYMASRFYGFDMLEAVRGIRHLVVHIHIHDNFGGAVHHYEKMQTHQIPFGRGDAHMPIGWGSVPLFELLSILIPEFDGMLMMELRSRYFDHIEESRNNLLSILNTLPKGVCED